MILVGCWTSPNTAEVKSLFLASRIKVLHENWLAPQLANTAAMRARFWANLQMVLVRSKILILLLVFLLHTVAAVISLSDHLPVAVQPTSVVVVKQWLLKIH